MVARAPLAKKNSRGKTVYLRKWFHAIAASGTNPNAHCPLTDAALLLEPFNTGAGPLNLIPVDPTDGTSGQWSFETHLFTHQVRRGTKKKAPAASNLFDISQLLQDLAALKTVVEALPK
jgi:hypothetical protein